MPHCMQYRLHWYTHRALSIQKVQTDPYHSPDTWLTHPSAHSTEYSTSYACSSALPGHSSTSSLYIWLSFSNLLSPTTFILSKSLFAVSILHLFIHNPNCSALLFMWTWHSLHFHTPFSHTQRTHLSSTTFYPRFSLFIISILHLCPQLQQSEINFTQSQWTVSHWVILECLSNSLKCLAISRANKMHSPLQKGNLACLLWPLLVSSRS